MVAAEKARFALSVGRTDRPRADVRKERHRCGAAVRNLPFGPCSNFYPKFVLELDYEPPPLRLKHKVTQSQSLVITM